MFVICQIIPSARCLQPIDRLWVATVRRVRRPSNRCWRKGCLHFFQLRVVLGKVPYLITNFQVTCLAGLNCLPKYCTFKGPARRDKSDQVDSRRQNRTDSTVKGIPLPSHVAVLPLSHTMLALQLLLAALPLAACLKFDIQAHPGHESAAKERCIRNFVGKDQLVVVTVTVSGSRGDGQTLNMHVSLHIPNLTRPFAPPAETRIADQRRSWQRLRATTRSRRRVPSRLQLAQRQRFRRVL